MALPEPVVTRTADLMIITIIREIENEKKLDDLLKKKTRDICKKASLEDVTEDKVSLIDFRKGSSIILYDLENPSESIMGTRTMTDKMEWTDPLKNTTVVSNPFFKKDARSYFIFKLK